MTKRLLGRSLPWLASLYFVALGAGCVPESPDDIEDAMYDAGGLAAFDGAYVACSSDATYQGQPAASIRVKKPAVVDVDFVAGKWKVTVEPYAPIETCSVSAGKPLVIRGTSGEDTLWVNGSAESGSAPPVYLFGMAGNDSLNAYYLTDARVYVFGGPGDDDIDVSYSRRPELRGGPGSDTLDASFSYKPALWGEEGQDLLYADRCTGGAVVNGGDDGDHIEMWRSPASVAYGGPGDDDIDASSDASRAYGEDGDDMLDANGASDVLLDGGAGDDFCSKWSAPNVTFKSCISY